MTEPDGSWTTPPGFEEYTLTDSRGIAYRVFRIGSGPGVLVLHELLGMSEPCLDVGRFIATRGMSAHLPLFFGRPGSNIGRKDLRQTLFCLRHEFALMARAQTSPLTRWITDAADQISQKSGGSKVGVVGMCLTGHLALAGLVSPKVGAAVVSQSSVPIRLDTWPCPASWRADLGVSNDDFTAIQQRRAPVMCLRFRNDIQSPKARAERLSTELQNVESVEVPAKGHAVLTDDLVKAEQAGKDPLTDVVEFLEHHLVGA